MLVNDSRSAPQFVFAPGKKYLIRIANIGGLACGQFHIEGYTLSVVEMDGVQTQPQNADTIVLCAGQTYGVVVQGKSIPLGGANYIVKMTTDMLTQAIPSEEVSYSCAKCVQDVTDLVVPNEQARSVVGNLVYLIDTLLGGLLTTIVDILSFNWQPASQFDDMSARPLDGQKLLFPVDNNIALTTNQTYFPNIGTRIGMSSSSDAQPYVPPKVPSLYTALTTSSNAFMDPATYGVGANPWVLKSGQVVQIDYYNADAFPHPLHLHVSHLSFGNGLNHADISRDMSSKSLLEALDRGTVTRALYRMFQQSAM